MEVNRLSSSPARIKSGRTVLVGICIVCDFSSVDGSQLGHRARTLRWAVSPLRVSECAPMRILSRPRTIACGRQVTKPRKYSLGQPGALKETTETKLGR